MESNKRCSRCGTLNEQEYVYCKNCGTALETEKETNTPNINYTPINYNTVPNSTITDYSEIEPEINGVDTKKIQAYVGPKNCDRIMQKFIMAFRTGKMVTGYNWIVFITGALLAFPFVSSWFFYRKMYKVGAILCAISIALTVAVTAIDFSKNAEYIKNEYNKVENYTAEEFLQYESDAIPTTSTAKTADAIIKFVLTVLLASTAWNIYYKQSLKNIKRLELSNFPNNNEFYQLAGMPSAAAAILIPIGIRFVEMIISAAPAISLIMAGADMEKIMWLLLL